MSTNISFHDVIEIRVSDQRDSGNLSTRDIIITMKNGEEVEITCFTNEDDENALRIFV